MIDVLLGSRLKLLILEPLHAIRYGTQIDPGLTIPISLLPSFVVNEKECRKCYDDVGSSCQAYEEMQRRHHWSWSGWTVHGRKTASGGPQGAFLPEA